MEDLLQTSAAGWKENFGPNSGQKSLVVFIWDRSRARRKVHVPFLHPAKENGLAQSLVVSLGVGSEVVPALASHASLLLFRAG